MDLGLKGRKTIILGGSRGMGRYTAGLMREEGASVAICARGA
ncbi:MAG: 3-ketoacyl-ACP reductase, partial [Alphaproteobacteria bacterium]|nr:3-ketoacyl-ACP reductase [Alphaproteobacteria bacterium]